MYLYELSIHQAREITMMYHNETATDLTRLNLYRISSVEGVIKSQSVHSPVESEYFNQ